MGIGAIGNNSYNNYYQGVNRKSSNVPFSTQVNNSPTINLKLTDEDTGDRALTCVGFPDGGSASVYKADNYTEANPQYRVKYWDNEGVEKEYFVNPQNVNPENASYVEMLAYSTYSDMMGTTNDAFGKFLQAAGGVNGDKTYDLSNIDTKMNFKSLVKEFMELQYSAGNLQGYLSYKQLYDYMDELGKNEKNESTDVQKLLSEKKNEIYEKLKNGDTEESFQIGGSTFTEKEWDKLLGEVDDITEEMREAMREEHQKRFEEAVDEEREELRNESNESSISALLADRTE